MVKQKMSIARKPFGFRLNSALVKRLKVLAVKKDMAVNVLLEEAIHDLLTKYKDTI